MLPNLVQTDCRSPFDLYEMEGDEGDDGSAGTPDLPLEVSEVLRPVFNTWPLKQLRYNNTVHTVVHHKHFQGLKC